MPTAEPLIRSTQIFRNNLMTDTNKLSSRANNLLSIGDFLLVSLSIYGIGALVFIFFGLLIYGYYYMKKKSLKDKRIPNANV